MVKRVIAWLMVAILTLALSVPSFAYTATPSDATPADAEEIVIDDEELIIDEDIEIASDSNADFEETYLNLMMFSSVPVASASNAGIMLMSDGETVTEYENTVDFSDVRVEFYYTDYDGVHHLLSKKVNEDGYFSIPDVGDFQIGKEIPYADRPYFKIVINRGSLPPSGTYQMFVSFASNTGGMTYVFEVLNCIKQITNSTRQSFGAYDVGFSQFSGDYSFTTSIDFQSLSSIAYRLTMYDEFYTPYGGFLSIRFEPMSGDAAIVQDPVDDIDVQLSISENTASIDDTLKELIKHISDQLAALWDQMYNYMHVPQLANDDKNTQAIIDKLGEDLTVEVQNQDDNTQEIIQNQDDNTNTIVNGYDPSAGQEADQQLSESFDNLAEKEDQIMDQISEPLDSFEFDNPISQYLDTFQLFGDFLQQLFVRSGEFQNVINLSFIMGIALMVIGLYRFKAGN